MASSYALPLSSHPAGNHHGHGHSFSASHLSPASANAKNSFSNANGGHVRKAASNGNLLYTHNETSRENSPYPSPEHEHDHSQAFKANIDAVQANGHSHSHAHNHDHSHSHSRAHSHSPGPGHSHSHSAPPMKGRARGESDLGRNDLNTSIYTPRLRDTCCVYIMVFSARGFDGAACTVAISFGFSSVFVERRINEWRRLPTSFSLCKIAAVSSHINVGPAVERACETVRLR